MDPPKICLACDAPIESRLLRCAGCQLPSKATHCECVYRCEHCTWRFEQADSPANRRRSSAADRPPSGPV